jgi:hypothetical protein
MPRAWQGEVRSSQRWAQTVPRWSVAWHISGDVGVLEEVREGDGKGEGGTDLGLEVGGVQFGCLEVWWCF